MTTLKNQIYIVDDDESMCRALGMLLNTFGFKVKTFPSAAKFISFILKNALRRSALPGCLVLDVHMPEMDGFTLQRKLFACGYYPPIIFISADRDIKLSDKYSKMFGSVGFLKKPFTGPELVDAINAVLEKQKNGAIAVCGKKIGRKSRMLTVIEK